MTKQPTQTRTKNNPSYEDNIALHTYRIEQLERENAKRYDKIIEKLDANFEKSIELEKKYMLHEERIKALEERHTNLSSMNKAIITAVAVEFIIEIVKLLKLH